MSSLVASKLWAPSQLRTERAATDALWAATAATLGLHAIAAATASSFEFIGIYLLTIPAIVLVTTLLLLGSLPLLKRMAARGKLTLFAIAAPAACLAAAFALLANANLAELLAPLAGCLCVAQFIFGARNFVPATQPVVD